MRQGEKEALEAWAQVSVVRIFRRTGLLLSSALLLMGGAAASASAAAPILGDTWATGVTASVAVFHAEVNPNGEPTTYHFEYISEAGYQANVEAAKDPFTGALVYPVGIEANIGVSTSFEEAVQHAGGMKPATTYLYRIATENPSGPSLRRHEEDRDAVRGLDIRTARPPWLGDGLPDRQKRGRDPELQRGLRRRRPAGRLRQRHGDVQLDLLLRRRGPRRAGGEPVPRDPHLFRMGDPEHHPADGGGRLFERRRALPALLSGPVHRPGDQRRPLPHDGHRLPGPQSSACGKRGTGRLPELLPARHRTGAYHALLTASDVAFTDVTPENFDVIFAGATPDLGQVAVSSCAALTADATEALVGGDACDPNKQNVYLWSPTGLRLLNVLPGDSQGTPGARLAAQDALSDDGSRAYFVDNAGGGLYLNEAGSGSTLVSSGGVFQAASSDGGVAFFTQGGHLYRYTAPSGPATDLTPSGGVLGVLGASDDGGVVYYLDGTGVHRWDGNTSSVADAADPGNYPPTTGTARVSADGSRLLFLSDEDLTEFESFGATQVYMYSEPGTGGSSGLVCVSCNPSGERPEGDASIPGAIANGEFAGATQLYKPRVLTEDGGHVFFDSADGLLPKDTNGEPDVFEWEAFGVSGCGLAKGCILPISSGRGKEGASFVDSSLDGTDAFFLTDESLFGPDPGGVDLYDARVKGGFPEPTPPLACEGDACQALPPKPEDPEPGTGFLTDELNSAVKIKTLHRRHRRHRKHHAKNQHRKHRGSGKSKGGRR